MLPTPEESILKYAVSRKDKLLYVGRRYDFAITKGNRRAMEAAVKGQAKFDERRKTKDGLRKIRTLNIEEKKRARLRKQRVDEVMKEKKKAFVLAKQARAKEKKLRKRRDADTSAGNGSEAGSNDAASTEDKANPAEDDPGTEKSDATPEDSGTPPSDPDPTATTTETQVQTGADEQAETVTDDQAEAVADDQAETAADDQAETVADDKAESLTATVTKTLSKLELQDRQSSQGSEDCPVSPLEESDEEEYESPLEEPEVLDDNDFEWNSDMDGPVDESDDEESDSNTEIFANDAWNAICVLGLRVYSLNCEAKVKVVKGEESSA